MKLIQGSECQNDISYELEKLKLNSECENDNESKIKIENNIKNENNCET